MPMVNVKHGLNRMQRHRGGETTTSSYDIKDFSLHNIFLVGGSWISESPMDANGRERNL